jgi:hypothetical protein
VIRTRHNAAPDLRCKRAMPQLSSRRLNESLPALARLPTSLVN